MTTRISLFFVLFFTIAVFAKPVNESLNCAKSTAIFSAVYNRKSETMSLRFRQKKPPGFSKTYTYRNFPEKLWTQWKAAKSKGGFYNEWIKARKWERK